MPASDPRARVALEVRIRAAQLRGETEEARLHIRRLVQWAKLRRDPEASAVAMRAGAEIHLRLGQADEAIAAAQEAVDVSGTMSPRAQAEACCTLGFAHALAWDFRHAEAAFRDAAGHDNHFHPAAWGLGRIRLDLEHAHAALPFLERAAQLAHKEGDRIRIAKYGVTLAQTQRIQGNLDKSLALAEAAYRSLDSCGADGASEARTQVALTLLALGRHREARALLEEELSLVAQRDDHAVIRVATGALWAACAAGADWERAAELAPIDGEGLALSRATELELVRLLHRFGERAFHAGQLILARDAWTPARQIYRRLGMSQDSAQLTHTLRSLPSSSMRARPGDSTRSTPSPGRRRLTRRRRDPS
jgi:tetratricopeptide (TPR) repeat protein